MSTRPKYDLIVELCAGTAALSWALGGLKFPVSRMGSKAGYSWSILSALGLSVGDMPRRFLWVEPDEELARTLALLTTPGGAAAVAEVIRSWIPCPNGHEADGGAWCLECATWDSPAVPVDDIALSCATTGLSWTLNLDEAHIERKRDGSIRRWASGPSTGKQDARRLWERLRKERPEASPEREGAWTWLRKRTFDGAEAFKPYEHGAGNWENPEETPRRLDTLAPLPATVVCGRAEDIEPARVGAWLYVAGTGVLGKGPSAGFGGESRPFKQGGVVVSEFVTDGARVKLAPRLDALASLPAAVLCARAEDVPTPPDCSRVLCYIDPPYAGTTGYAHLFPREAVVAVARKWAEAGAHVVISEAEPIPELVADGWTFADIADARIGQRRTFSKQQREVLTSNRPLVDRAAWPARDALPGQEGLFG